ncbi:MAG: hypothetical protein KIT17_19735, partial [Rubrivivax sp.]|nr:hypothetical protein [Rubrivivax sp.]
MSPPIDPSTPAGVSVRLRLFGAPQVELAGEPGVDAERAERAGRAPQALPFERRHQLVAWLALKRGWIGRPELAALLWPGQESRLALANLRKALHRLHGVPWAVALQASGQALRFAAETDVRAFEAALAAGRPDEALALYGGDLLAGFDDGGNAAWTERLRFERERLRTAWRDAALRRL